MASNRPHMSLSAVQLQDLFAQNKESENVLKAIVRELKHRTTPSAVALRKKVEIALAILSGEASPHGTGLPSHQTINCRNCDTGLRIPVKDGKVTYVCPSCKSDFEVVGAGGVLQVTWIETREGSTKPEPEMSDAVARSLLGVNAQAGFPDIKAAWRKASQQYHPDKHQGLPERLKQAAELEMQRINEAYRFLERVTADDF